MAVVAVSAGRCYRCSVACDGSLRRLAPTSGLAGLTSFGRTPMHDIDARQLRSLIDKALLTDADLDAFVIDHFPEVKKRFSAQMNRVSKVNLLFEYSDIRKIANHLYHDHPTLPLNTSPTLPSPSRESRPSDPPPSWPAMAGHPDHLSRRDTVGVGPARLNRCARQRPSRAVRAEAPRERTRRPARRCHRHRAVCQIGLAPPRSATREPGALRRAAAPNSARPRASRLLWP